jgi:RHH-type transcriptional regulator, proline utilization regulon repressor / proline dehydrogenase / delta 1-pyrroline-5-carboxylate dehydrogenase
MLFSEALLSMLSEDLRSPSALRAAVRADHRLDEAACVSRLAQTAAFSAADNARAEQIARDLVMHLREQRRQVGGIDALMQEYDLSSEEGVTLMCLAEALLRIPDALTQNQFIEEKLGAGDWQRHLGLSDTFFVNASTFGLMVAGRLVSPREQPADALNRLLRRLGEPVIRQAVRRAMRVLGRQFVLGETIDSAQTRARDLEARGYRFSYDMLGEAARTDADAQRYFDRYCAAIEALSGDAMGQGPERAPGISVKLSALHPRYEFAQRASVHSVLLDRLMALTRLARERGVGLCVDAEESDRLELSLNLIERVALEVAGDGWDGFGLAVQAYQKRAFALIDWLVDLANRAGTRLLTRLVKGAYWDMEIKRSQEGGFDGFPVFTRKVHTDVSYLACAKKMLDGGSAFYPCFATHNARTVAALTVMVGDRRDFEFQRLHGMGEALYQKVVEQRQEAFACRVYAPVGGHEDLLAYLVRRLLENGANTSFVNRMADDSLPVDDLVADPVQIAAQRGFAPHPGIVAPGDLYAPDRRNSRGIDLADPAVVMPLKSAMDAAAQQTWAAAPVIGGEVQGGPSRAIWGPADRRVLIGRVVEASAEQARLALARAAQAADAWSSVDVQERGRLLLRTSDLLEAKAPALMALICREAGRTALDAHLEVREAVDFLRYYAAQAARLLAAPATLPGPTGETNELHLVGRGPFLCIAPWNFPLAIFTGQVAAALAAGCPVLAKPAEQTPLIAAEVVRLMHEAGIPADVLHLLPGDGPALGEAVLGDRRLAGVAFTGGTDTARRIHQTLAQRDGPMIPLIAETGGINAMIVDSTALAEQVTRDVMTGAFQSAGQRCSALRLLCVQEDVAERQLEMIAGAMRVLVVGDPGLLATDVGPIIDEEALERLRAYGREARRRFRVIGETPVDPALEHGLFLSPVAFEIPAVGDLQQEIFGPVLHVVRWGAGELDQLVDDINALGYGLTLAVHSRSETTARRVMQRARVGNLYVNRNQIGAVVGVQPFGGEGLSGTGPKAGGPRYLERFLLERTVTIDTTAAGGNASLLTIEP